MTRDEYRRTPARQLRGKRFRLLENVGGYDLKAGETGTIRGKRAVRMGGVGSGLVIIETDPCGKCGRTGYAEVDPEAVEVL